MLFAAVQESAIGTKRTCRFALHMSAFGGKADIGWIAASSRFGDSDVADVARLALCGLVQQAADSAA